MTRDLLDEIKNKWNIPVTLPMAVPWGKDDVVWLVQEIERLRAENERLRGTRERGTLLDEAQLERSYIQAIHRLQGSLVECAKCHILTRADTACGACGVKP